MVAEKTTNEMYQVGKSIPKVDAREKVLGRAQYIADLTRPNMLFGAMLQSPYAHARIIAYDTTAAEKVTGVKCVLTGDDFEDHKMGPFIKDEGAIAKGKVRYMGEPVACVAAEDEVTARAAALLINVEYEELPTVLSPEAALEAGAAVLHEDLADYFKVFEAIAENNLMSYTEISEGDVDKAWDECDLIVENVYETQAQNHLSLEPCGALAEVEPDGLINLWSANQSVFRVQANVCECLGLPMSRVRSMTPKVGAGFDNKMEAHIQPLCVALALATKRPVKMILSREEDFETVRARHPFKIRCKTGVKKDGTFVAREVELLLDGGAFADDSPGVLGNAALMSMGPYHFPHAKAFGKVAYTNHLRFAAFRGFGNPQVTFAGEAQIDEIADKLGIDPIDLRLKNVLAKGQQWFGGQKVDSNGVYECLEKVRASSDWDNKRKNSGENGIGISVAGHISGLLATGAIVRMLEDGTFVLNTGATDIGQGSDTVLTQICAEALQIPIDRIRTATPDTDASPYNWGTTASRVTYTTGRAVVGAAEDAVRQIKDYAAIVLESPADDLELREGGMVGIKGANKEVSFFEIAAMTHWGVGGPIVGSHTLVFDQPTIDPKRAVAKGMPFTNIGVFTFAAMVSEVAINQVTGKASAEGAWYAVDVGQAINPGLVEGQIDGGYAQGLGYALFEEMVWDDGRLANPTLMDYKAPGTAEVPYDIDTIIVEHPEPDGPFGAKGVGEITLVTVPASICNAITHASGVRLRKMPFLPERVLNGIIENEIT